MPNWYDSLNLTPREVAILNGAIGSIVKFGIPDFLPPQGKGSRNAAKRLIERGYLARSDAQMSPPNDWIVVRFTGENRDKMLADASSMAEGETRHE